MTEEKIKITYEDLKDPKVDETLAQASSLKMRVGIKDASKGMGGARFIYKRWFYLMIVGIVGGLIAWGLMYVTNSLTSPKERPIEIGNSKYVLSKEAQKYLKVYDISNYEKSKSVIIIEEPHYSIEGQISLYKGLEVFFCDNPTLVNKTIFLSEGMPSNQPISVKPLVDVDPNPSEELIEEVFGSFLVTGYIAYEWKYQENIPIVGIEDNNLYQLSSKLWIETQNNKDDEQTIALWNVTVTVRNKSISNTLIEKTKIYENPILFVGGAHLRKQSSYDFQKLKYGNYGNVLTPEESAYLDNFENLGIYDYLKQEKIGYTFLVPIPNHFESSKDLERNISTYIELFKAQQNGDYNEYIELLISEQNLELEDEAVTVAPSTKAAAQFAKASTENKDKNKKDGKKGDGKKGDGKKGGNGGKPREAEIKGDKIIEGQEISEKEAAERVKKDEDVKANSKEQAERIARDAGDGKDPIHEDPHKPGYSPHYHSHGHGKAHVFY